MFLEDHGKNTFMINEEKGKESGLVMLPTSVRETQI
jgi:hypothetical protein